MDKELFKDRILETENLTDELEDNEAEWLLNWGINHLGDVLQGVLEDEEAAGERVNSLMRVMRKINRISGAYQSSDPSDLAEELAVLREMYQAAFGHLLVVDEFSPEDYQLQAERLSGLPVHQALELLTQIFEQTGADNPPNETVNP